MVDIQLAVLTLDQAERLKSLLVKAAQKAHPLRRVLWDNEIELKATDAVLALDDLLVKFLMIADDFKKKWAQRKDKKSGRRSPTENYWLAGEIAEIVGSVPGVEIKYSKGDQTHTVYMKILGICFGAVGHEKSVERVAVDVARERRPVAIGDETWATYKAAISKRKKSSSD